MGWLLHDPSPPPTPPWGPEAQLPKWRGEGGPVLNPQGFGEANVYAEALVVKNLPVSAGNKRHRFSPWVRKIPWNRKWQLTLVFLPGESHGQRSLAGYSPWSHKESDMTERLSTHTVKGQAHCCWNQWSFSRALPSRNLSLESRAQPAPPASCGPSQPFSPLALVPLQATSGLPFQSA